MNLLSTIVGDNPKVTVEVTISDDTLIKICVGLLSVIVIGVVLWGIIRKTSK